MRKEELSELELSMAGLKTARDVEAFIIENCDADSVRFYEYLNRIIEDKKLKVADVMKRSNINQNYGYNIVNGARKNPGRDKVIAICIGSGMTFRETQEALDRAKAARLYYRSERDVRIAAALNNHVRDVVKVNMELSDNGLEPLSV